MANSSIVFDVLLANNAPLQKSVGSTMWSTYNKLDVFDFSNPHIDLLTIINWEADVEKVIFMGHTANLH